MRLVVLGATGGTGMEVVRQAIARGHAVTALVRSPEKLQSFDGWVSVQRGNLLDASTLERTIRGHHAVISAFGPRVPVVRSEAHLLEQFANAVTSAMRRAEVRRIVVESVAFLFKDSLMPPAYLVGRLLFPVTVADTSAMERIFGESGLDWTMVRPPELTNGAYTGKYRVREGHLPRFGFKVSRADVADFMIRMAENHASAGKVYGVAS